MPRCPCHEALGDRQADGRRPRGTRLQELGQSDEARAGATGAATSQSSVCDLKGASANSRTEASAVKCEMGDERRKSCLDCYLKKISDIYETTVGPFVHLPSWDMATLYQCSVYHADERARQPGYTIDQLRVIECARLDGDTKQRVARLWKISDMGVQYSFGKNYGGKHKLGPLPEYVC